MPAPRPEPVRSYALLAPEVKRHYLAYFKMTFADGRLDLRTKELVALGAALITGAPNVLAGHLAKLRKLGVSEEEIHEAVAVALGVAGASVVDRGDVAEQALRAASAAKAADAANAEGAEGAAKAEAAAPRKRRRPR